MRPGKLAPAHDMVLEIKIREPVKQSDRTLRFTQSPVRIGRNQLNDIPLEDPFVSEWHGIIRFDGDNVAYFDLGSTNGTLLDGKRLAKNVPAVLTEASRLQLGRLEMSVSQPRAVTGAHRPLTGPHKTVGWSAGTDPGRTPSGAPRGVTPPPSESVSRAGSTRMGLADPGAALPRSPSGAFAVTPPPGPETPLPGPATPPPGTPAAQATARAAAAALAPASDAAARTMKILEAFSEAFIGLRKGYEQFGSEVGVRTINGSTPLHRARTGREVLDHLLNPAVDPAVAARDLIGIFADFGIHHIAMMEGVTEGVRSVLQSLDPRANELEAGPRLFAGARAKEQWKNYLDRFDQVVTEDEQLHASIFGDEFARAYASVTLGDKGPASGGDR